MRRSTSAQAGRTRTYRPRDDSSHCQREDEAPKQTRSRAEEEHKSHKRIPSSGRFKTPRPPPGATRPRLRSLGPRPTSRHAGRRASDFRPFLLGVGRIPLVLVVREGAVSWCGCEGRPGGAGKECRGRGGPFCGGRRRRRSRARWRRLPLTEGRGGCTASPPPSSSPRGSPCSSSTSSSDTATVNEV